MSTNDDPSDVTTAATREDAADVRAAEAARAEMRETGVPPVPWEEVKAELGCDPACSP